MCSSAKSTSAVFGERACASLLSLESVCTHAQAGLVADLARVHGAGPLAIQDLVI